MTVSNPSCNKLNNRASSFLEGNDIFNFFWLLCFSLFVVAEVVVLVVVLVVVVVVECSGWSCG